MAADWPNVQTLLNLALRFRAIDAVKCFILIEAAEILLAKEGAVTAEEMARRHSVLSQALLLVEQDQQNDG